MVDIVIPALGESIREATIARWLKKPGEAVKRDEPVVELDTDKVSVTVPAPSSGVLEEQKFAEGATVKVGQSIGSIDGAAAPSAPPAHPAAAPVAPPSPLPIESHTPTPMVAARDPAPRPAPQPVAAAAKANDGGAAPMPPSMRRYLREHEIDPSQVKPAVPGGRVTFADVARAEHAPAAAPAPSAPTQDEEVAPMTPLRRRIAERLVQAQHTAAILTTFNEIDMSAIMALRAKHQDAFKTKYGIKLGFMSFFVRASCEALKEWPGVNAEIRGDAIVYKKRYHVGVAVGGGAGLVVPVIRDADRLSFAQIEKTIGELAERAKEKKLALADLQGGTFSITNGGIYGSLLSTPLLNPPQTGILGMHNIVKRPIATADDKVEVRPMMYVALSYDHRVVDGREAVSFLVSIKKKLEEPERLLLEV